MLVEAYDVLIFGPLWLENMIKARVADRASRATRALEGGQQ